MKMLKFLPDWNPKGSPNNKSEATLMKHNSAMCNDYNISNTLPVLQKKITKSLEIKITIIEIKKSHYQDHYKFSFELI